MVSPTALVIVLALFLAFAGFAGLLIGKTLRDGERARDTAGNLIILALAFAVVALLALQYAVPLLEELLGTL